MNNFWNKIKKPIYALAPMAGITDSAFRQMCKKFGADVVCSEMASAAALSYQPKKTLEMLEFDEIERPYVVQLFGSEPEYFRVVTELISGARTDRSGYRLRVPSADGIDINFGCPVPKVVKQGAGIALFSDLKRSREVIKTVIDSTDLPVSVKTRSRVGDIDVLRFLDNIKDLDVKAIMIHGRTPAQGFSGPVDAEIIQRARDYFGGAILANGGIYSRDDAVGLLEQTKADGVGIAQGALGRPWIFKAARTGQSAARSRRAVFKEAMEHVRLAGKLKGKQGIIEMRKHLCWYVAGMPGARKIRNELVNVNSIRDIERIFKDFRE